MLEKLCPLFEGILMLAGVSPAVACPIARFVPRLIETVHGIVINGGDPYKELGTMLDAVEAAQLAKAEKGFGDLT